MNSKTYTKLMKEGEEGQAEVRTIVNKIYAWIDAGQPTISDEEKDMWLAAFIADRFHGLVRSLFPTLKLIDDDEWRSMALGSLMVNYLCAFVDAYNISRALQRPINPALEATGLGVDDEWDNILTRNVMN